MQLVSRRAAPFALTWLDGMNTAQLLLSKNAQTQQSANLAPWIIGGIVVIVALVLISRIK